MIILFFFVQNHLPLSSTDTPNKTLLTGDIPTFLQPQPRDFCSISLCFSNLQFPRHPLHLLSSSIMSSQTVQPSHQNLSSSLTETTINLDYHPKNCFLHLQIKFDEPSITQLSFTTIKLPTFTLIPSLYSDSHHTKTSTISDRTSTQRPYPVFVCSTDFSSFGLQTWMLCWFQMPLDLAYSWFRMRIDST